MSEIFVSYSWDTDAHQEKVISLVNFLRSKGHEAECDIVKIQEETSINFQEMMALELSKSKKVIIVLSKEYKRKADLFLGGVGIESRYILDDINKNKKKYILVSFEKLDQSLLSEIVPNFLRSRDIVDLISDEKNDYFKLFSKLNDLPQYHIEEVSVDKHKTLTKKVKDFTFITEEEKKKHQSFDIDMFGHPSTFFDYRLSKAFPGTRGIQWFEDPKVATDRLQLLLKSPLRNKKLYDPIWFFRGSSCLYIKNFDRISETKCIIGIDECLIQKIIVYKSDIIYRSFVYVELKPEMPTGVYPNIDSEYIEERLRSKGYAYEEYAEFQGKPISREDYDDDATVVDGQVVDLDSKAKIRMRYLTPYNFIICGKFHPFNSPNGDIETNNCLNGILNGTVSFEKLVEAAENLPKNRNEE
ncbi:MAG: hypothetical protein EOM04_00770 [Clostridia bacterium]|nr:hypothetical protein [Clostridia bacterium]